MAEPTREGYIPFDSKRLHKFLESTPLWAVTDNGEVGQIAPQERSSRAYTEVTGFPTNQSANENQLQFGAGLRNARVCDALGWSNAILWDKKKLVVVRGKLSTHVGRSRNDGCGVAIG
jgi:hypothetical protein